MKLLAEGDGDNLSHTPKLHPHVPSLELVTSLLVSVVTTVSSLAVCPTDVKLMDMGLNSFDIVRIANQIPIELERCFGSCDSHMTTNLEDHFGSHDSHMTMLVQMLLDSDIESVVHYITTELSSSVTRKRSLELNADPLQTTKKLRGEPVIAKESHAGHVTVMEKSRVGHVTVNQADHATVRSWRRGQHFINGK